MPVKVLITGASGLLGRAIHKVLHHSFSKDIIIKALCNSRVKDDLVACDLTNTDATKNLICDFKPDMIIHCAAERKPDVIEKQPDVAQKINIEVTENIAQLASSLNCCVLFVSTDYVMDGKNPPYFEDAVPNPLNAYGLSKLQGEKIVVATSPNNIVLRVPILYGDVEFLSESAVTILYTKVLDPIQPVPMSHYERRYPTHCDDVAAFIADILSKKLIHPSPVAANIQGIFHFSGSEEMTKYDMSMAMARVFGLPSDHLRPDESSAGGAARPYNAHIASKRAQDLGLTCTTRTFEQGIRDCLSKWSA